MNDQLIRLIDELLLCLDEERISFHQTKRAETLRAHEHFLGVEIARHIVFER